MRENLTTRNQAGLRKSSLGVLRPSVGDNLLELRVGEEHVIDIIALDRLVWSESYGQGISQSVCRVAEVSHQGAQLLLGRAQLCETEAVDLGNDGGDLGTGEKVTGATQDTRLVALGINLDELGETGLRAAKNIVKADEKDRFFGQWSGQKSGGDSAVRSECVIAGMIFHPSRVKSQLLHKYIEQSFVALTLLPACHREDMWFLALLHGHILSAYQIERR